VVRGCLLVVLGFILGGIAVVAAAIFMYGPAPVLLPSPTRYDARVTLTTSFLQRQLQSEAAGVPAGNSFQNLAVETADGDQVVIAGTLARGVVRAPMRITLQPTVQQNRIALRVVRANLGGLPIPIAFLRPLEDAMNRQLASMLGNQPYQIVGVTTSPQGVSIDLTVT
jgi:uncharacterized protein YpmS